jgi:hypothetical protein
VENGAEQTAVIEAVLPGQFLQREQALLAQAQLWLARLPFDEADLLVVDEIGKNISGTGLDTNVVGRKANDHGSAAERPFIKRIYVRGLTPETHGNASGLGIAEFTRSDVLAQIDWHATYENCLTAGHPTAAMLPVHFPQDRQVLAAALRTIGLRTPATARVIWIRNTLDLHEVECSRAYWNDGLPAQAQRTSDVRALGWDAAGNWPSWEAWSAGQPLAQSGRSADR